MTKSDEAVAQHFVTIGNTGETFRCDEQEAVLKAMERLRRKGIPVGCRNGGCGVCKVRVTSGEYVTRKMSRAVLSCEEEDEGCVLACKAYPRSDLRVEVIGRMVRAVVHGINGSCGVESGRATRDFQSKKET